VRDTLRGVPPHDKDYVVAGLGVEKFGALFGSAVPVGRGFPVYQASIGGTVCDVALTRLETKTGTGYRGFSVSSGGSASIYDDLCRRDTTMNSMARDLLTGELIDPFGGADDIADRVIRATSEHFGDDPVRALRAARQSALFGYSIDARTVRLMSECRGELASEPRERAADELARALCAPRPSVFFRALAEAGLLDAAYPHIFAPAGAEAFDRTMLLLDRVADETDAIGARFAALAHGVGGNADMWIPSRWVACAEFAAAECAMLSEISSPREIVEFLERLRRNPIGLGGISAIIRALGRKTPDFLANGDKYYEAMDAVSGYGIPEKLNGPARGKWLRERKIEAITRITENTV
jgi:tRNA nucleotidyltransferase (CCA-adding enzyme)